MKSKKIDNFIHSIGLKYNLSDDIVKKIVESQFEFTKKKLNEIDFSLINSEEDFENLKKIFYFKGLGRIYINKRSLNKILKIKKDDGND